MFYTMHVWQSAMTHPLRMANGYAMAALNNASNPMRNTYWNRTALAAGNLFEQVTRRYGRPRFGTFDIEVDGKTIEITPKVEMAFPFCNLLHFKQRERDVSNLPRLLIVSPMAGHFATLLRGTVVSMLPHCDVWITEWRDARDVALSQGDFDFFDYMDYLHQFLQTLGKNGATHVMAVCQPTVPCYALTAWMDDMDDPHQPRSLVLLGGPIDAAAAPTSVTEIAARYPLSWFRDKVVDVVPFPYAGMGRRVYPGFLQLTNFMSMNPDRHLEAHVEIFKALVVGDEETSHKRTSFYEEYRTVMDLTESFYLQTLDLVFQRRVLVNGGLVYRGRPISGATIRRTPVLTLEGERDDICAVGQTSAAIELSTGLAREDRRKYVQKGVGHYGLFNGRKFTKEVVPQIMKFLHHYERAPLR